MNYQDLNSIEGLQFIPVNSQKVPVVKNWQTTVTKYDLTKVEGVGLVCGEPSGNVECIDIDLKYDLTGKLFESYKRLIHEIDKDLLGKLVVQKTRSGGYHFVYRCSKIEGNQKLANRATTEEERQETYDKTYQAELKKEGATEEKARKVAAKAKENDTVRVLFETRGIGGQFVCYPTNGYNFVFGDLCSITEITPDERDTLINIARQFNEVFEEIAYKPTAKEKRDGISVFDDYNERGDVVGLLESHGWTIVGNKGSKVIFLRPGQTTSASSGNYDQNKHWFSVFTTSTEFEPQKAYLPYAVFATLECKGNYTEACKRLAEMGFGEKLDAKPKEKESTRVIKSRISLDDNDLSFLATANDYDGYLQQVIDGTLPMGLTTGSPKMDKHFLFKEGNLVMINGHDNTGKSVFVWWLLMIAALYHGWAFIIFASENTLGGFMRKMIQFYWGKPLRGFDAQTPAEYAEAKAFVEKFFKVIKAQEDMFNYKDIINMVKKAKMKYPNLKGGMIDPYNSLKTDLSGFSKLSTHDYHYEALSEIKLFGQLNKFGWFINHHAVTESLRKLDKDGFITAPQKADTEGGGKVANKADDFITIHRKTQHPTDWTVNEIHVRKIKDTETGGRCTPLNEPVLFEMYRNQCGFREKSEMGYEIDPIQEWHRIRRGERPMFREDTPMERMRLPYKEEDDIPDITF